MHVTLRQLRAFLCVADHGSFSQAAKSMHLSQAALSGLVKELEAQVGVRLLDRDTRNVALTEVGESFGPMVRRLLADLDGALEDLNNLRELRRGVVRVAAPETLSCTLMPELIRYFEDEYPGIEIRFEDVPIEQVRAGLHNGSIDIGLGPGGAILDEEIRKYAMWTDPLWVALNADDPLCAQDDVRWSDLRDRAMYTYMRNFERAVLRDVPVESHPRRIVPSQRVNTAFSMVKSRGGATVFPSMASGLLRAFDLQCRPLVAPVVVREIALFSKTQAHISPAVAAFQKLALDFAKTWVKVRASEFPLSR